MAKVTTIQSSPPRKGCWLVWLGVLLAVLFLAVLVFLLLNFLGVVSLSSLPRTLPWFQSPAVESEQIQQQEQLARENAGLQADLAQLSSRLQDKESEIAALQEQVERLQAELAELTRQEEAFAAMASVYGRMDPQAAAVILGKLPTEEILPLLGKLKKDQAAAILALMDSEKASELTRAWARIEPES